MSKKVNEMFSDISPKYDLLNNIFTFGLHKKWKKELLNISTDVGGGRVLDIASGTGDIALLFAKQNYKVTALDFSEKMLEVLRKRVRGSGRGLAQRIEIVQGDALNLPFDDNSFDIATIGYGIRNVDDPRKCLREMARVVKKGGLVLILETGQASGVIGMLNKFYSSCLMPLMGNLFARNYSAYKYLSDTAGNFPYGTEFTQMMRETGIEEGLQMRKVFFGVSYIYWARVS